MQKREVLVEFGFRICVYFFFWVTLCVCSSELLEQFLSKKERKNSKPTNFIKTQVQCMLKWSTGNVKIQAKGPTTRKEMQT